MFFDFTPNNALELLKLLSPLLVIFATYLASRVDMRAEYKIGLAFLASAAVAALTAYGEGQLQTNFWSNLTYIFTSAQAVYATVFKLGGLEKFLKPVEALASAVAQEAKEQVADTPRETAKEVLDPTTSKEVQVTTQVTNTK